MLCARVELNLWLLTNRMSELFTSGSVGGLAGNRQAYPEMTSTSTRGYVIELAGKVPE